VGLRRLYTDITFQKFILGLIYKAQRHEDVWGNEGTAPTFLTSALNGGEWTASGLPL
jgi:hypothetical protein